MQRLKHWKTHKIATAVASTLLICAAVGFAYYLSTITFSGEGESQPGKSASTISETLTVAPPAGLTPGTMAAIVNTIKPTTEVVLEPGAKLTYTITTSNEATCKGSWFELEGKGTSQANEFLLSPHETTKVWKYEAGKTDTAIAGLELRFAPSATENQSGCESAKVKVKLTLTGSGT